MFLKDLLKDVIAVIIEKIKRFQPYQDRAVIKGIIKTTIEKFNIQFYFELNELFACIEVV